MTRVLGQCLLVCALASFSLTAVGAEKKSTASTKSSASKAKTAEKEELTGRLPRYFASLVDEKQREEIYEIQASYRDEIEELEKQLAALKKDEMTAIEKVLTTTQRKKLADLRDGKQVATSKTATSKTSSSKSSTSSRSTKTKPASSRSSTSNKTSTKKK